jgi:hypothetical protein
MKNTRYDFSLSHGITGFAWLALLAVTVYSAWLSFKLIKIADIAFMYYNAWLINTQGFFPYRDIVDTSFPGSFLAYSFITRVWGYSDLSFHAADITILIILLILTWLMIKPLGRLPAAVAVLSYAAYYVGANASMHMQRDYLGLLPIATSIVLLKTECLSLQIRSFLIGILFGVAISIKPQLGIGLPIILFGLSRNGVLPVLSGLLAYMTSLMAWLYTHDALAPFIDIVQNLLPLYLTGTETSNGMGEKARDFFSNNFLPLLMMSLLPLCASIGSFFWHRRSDEADDRKTYAAILFLMVPAYMLATLSGLRLWDYHLMPMDYFLIISGSLLFKKIPALSKKQRYMGMVFKTIFILNIIKIGLLPNISFIASFDEKVIREEVSADEIASYLQSKQSPGEKIQLVVSSTNVPLFSILLNTQQVMATRYPLCWFCSSSHTSVTGTRLKNLFAHELQNKLPPTIILDSNSFGEMELHYELQDLLSEKYQKDYHYRQFKLYRLRK